MTRGLWGDEGTALRLDAEDRLAGWRQRFHLPAGPDGRPRIYFCGNSLGLQPRSARSCVDTVMDEWRTLGVDGYFRSPAPWYSYDEIFRESVARLVGARPGEVTMMNGLTVNLHLMMATFYRPTRERHAILVEGQSFPSDRYATVTHIRHRGLDPEPSLVVAEPRAGEATLRTEDVEALLADRGREIALVLWPGVQYVTGQAFDIARITAAARRQGCTVGLDLAHAVGNVVLRLHDWQVDFAVWCNYKYLNAGPGAVGGCFVHEGHGGDPTLPRLAGWWGNDPATRFEMGPEFVPRAGAVGWQVSSPPILALAPLRASLAIFDEVGMEALRNKSVRLTGYLQELIDTLPGDRVEVITPRDPEARGCQLSLRVCRRPRELLPVLAEAGVVCDFRQPDVIRVAPVPLYNTFHEVWRFAQILGEAVSGHF